MKARLRWIAALVGLGTIGCGAAEAPETKTPDPGATGAPTTTPTPAAQPTAVPTSTASADSEVPALPAKKHDEDGADGIRRWRSFDGPKTGSPITTKRAWVAAPYMADANAGRLSFESVYLFLTDVVSSSADETVFEVGWMQNKHRYAVPNSLARPAEAPQGLKKGTIARCPFGNQTVICRIEAVEAKQVTCALRFTEEKTEKVKLAPEEVFTLDGKLSFGATAIVKFEADLTVSYEMWVVAASGDDVWVASKARSGPDEPRVGTAVHKVKASNVTRIDPTKPLKVGDDCLATEKERVMPCKVTGVIDGLAYRLSFKGSGPKGLNERGLDQVAPAPKKK